MSSGVARPAAPTLSDVAQRAGVRKRHVSDMAGVETVLAAAGHALLLLSVVPDAECEKRGYRTLVADNRVDGLS